VQGDADEATIKLALQTLATFDLRPMVLTEFVRDVVGTYLDWDNAYVPLSLSCSVVLTFLAARSVPRRP
jgi:hypothetical protein